MLDGESDSYEISVKLQRLTVNAALSSPVTVLAESPPFWSLERSWPEIELISCGHMIMSTMLGESFKSAMFFGQETCCGG